MSRFSFLFIIFIFNSVLLNSQELTIEKIGVSEVFKKGITVSNHIISGQGINYETRIEIEKILEENKNELFKKGILNPPNSKGIILGLPLQLKDGLTEPGFYSISSYVDHNLEFPDQLLDFNCGEITYDLETGYNHEGTDYYLWPFPWYKMENNEVEVIAAAPGIIIYKTEGNFDQNCDGEDLPWNAVFLQHEDGSVTWYGHLKDGSLTEKFVGEEVEIGEYLGVVGSSGISVIPHLHFEVHDVDGNVVDPFFGDCNPSLEESLWIDQIPYLESGINHIACNYTVPAFPECPTIEKRNESSTFSGNDTIFLSAYFRNFTTNEALNISIIRPDGTIWEEWLWNNPLDFYTSSWNYWFIILKNEMEGNWNYTLKYKEEVYEHEFYYSHEASVSENTISQLSILPNPVTSFAEIVLTEENSNPIELEITNILGNKIQLPYELNENASRISMDCNSLETGIYLIRIEKNNSIYIGKLIKQ